MTIQTLSKHLSRYNAQEYMARRQLKSDDDIWSFGVVIYEILTGRQVYDINLPLSDIFLMDWVQQFPADSKKFRMIIDPRLNNQYSLSAARKVAKLADNCRQNRPEDRPSMSTIIDVLQEAIKDSEDEIDDEILSSLLESST